MQLTHQRVSDSYFEVHSPCPFIIVESLEVEGASEGHVAPLPCSEQGHRSPITLTRAWSSPRLDSLQGRSNNHISRRAVLVSHYPHWKILFLYIQPKSTLFKLEAISPCSVTTNATKESVPFILVAPLEKLKGLCQVTLQLSLLTELLAPK